MRFSISSVLLLAAVSLAAPLFSAPEGRSLIARGVSDEDAARFKPNPDELAPEPTGNAKVDSKRRYDFLRGLRRLEGQPDDPIWDEYARTSAKDWYGVDPLAPDEPEEREEPPKPEGPFQFAKKKVSKWLEGVGMGGFRYSDGDVPYLAPGPAGYFMRPGRPLLRGRPF